MYRISVVATILVLLLLLPARLDAQAGAPDDRRPRRAVPIVSAPAQLGPDVAPLVDFGTGVAPARRMVPLGTTLVGAAVGGIIGATGALIFARGSFTDDRIIVIYTTVPAGVIVGGVSGLIYGLTRH